MFYHLHRERPNVTLDTQEEMNPFLLRLTAQMGENPISKITIAFLITCIWKYPSQIPDNTKHVLVISNMFPRKVRGTY